MKVFLICCAVFVFLLFVAFWVWFFSLKAKGRCPLCAMKKIVFPRKLTIDPTQFEAFDTPMPAPLMGWSSWNTFYQHVNEDIILESAEAMEKSGLKEAGYTYINIDDCWQSSLRDINGRWQADFTSFPSGIPALIERINQKGLKVGLYSSNGLLTCEDLPASLGRETGDAETLAAWGCEFFKYDYCHHKAESGIAPTIEYLEISKPGEKPFAVIRPEDVTYTGRAHTVKEKKLKSGKAMGYLSYGGGTASFGVQADHAGEYVLSVHYRKRKVKKAPYLLLKIGSRHFEVLFPRANAFTTFGKVQAIIELEAGENRIELSNPIVNHSDSAFLQYRRMGMALQKASEGKKPIAFSICEWGMNRPYFWGKMAGNMWRTTPDIWPRWSSIVPIYNHTIRLWKYADRGHYNDPDMLEVGNGKLTEEENKSHFTLWCMMAAPLVLGNDIRKFIKEDGTPDTDNRTLQIVTNRALIAIDADPLAKPAKRVKCGRVDILARPLENGDIALCFFNKHGGAKKARFDVRTLGKDAYFSLPENATFHARELWSDEVIEGGSFAVSLPKHGVKVYRIQCT